MASLPRLQHVSVPYERGLEDELRAFYGELLGLRAKAPPEALGPEFLWFEAGPDELELHVMPEESFPDPGARRHFCLAVDDVDELRRRVEERGLETREGSPIPNRPRFFVRDPAGNLVELTAIEGPYR